VKFLAKRPVERQRRTWNTKEMKG